MSTRRVVTAVVDEEFGAVGGLAGLALLPLGMGKPGGMTRGKHHDHVVPFDDHEPGEGAAMSTDESDVWRRTCDVA